MDAMSIGAQPGVIETRFRALLDDMDAPRILELGTRRWDTDPTHHGRWCPEGAEHVKADITEGEDVDVVTDAHCLIDTFGTDAFDAAIAVAVWEHLERPWIAASELAHVCKRGAPAIIVTHQTFPLHGYPSDHFRFSAEAMKTLFGPPLWASCDVEYRYPCQIVPPPEVTRWNTNAEAYLNVEALAVVA